MVARFIAIVALVAVLAGCGSGDYGASIAGNATVRTPLGTFTYPVNATTATPAPTP